MKIQFILLLITILPYFNAFATSPVANVGTATVNEGALSVEWRNGYTQDSKRLQIRQHLDYGFTDWYAFRLVTAQNKPHGEDFDFSSYTIENRFQLLEAREHGWDGSIRLNYNRREGDASDGLDLFFIGMGHLDEAERWTWRHNTIFTHDIGANRQSGMTFEMRHGFARKLTPPAAWITNWEVGTEIYNDFDHLSQLSGYDAQSHQIGPITRMRFSNDMYLYASYHTGLSDASPDHIFKLFVGKRF